MRLHSSMLGSLRFFEATARLLSFKHAATELHVTHSAASQQIKHLEAVLGVKLFYRLARRVDLTPEGARFAAVVRRALDDIDSEASAISSTASIGDVRLRVGPSFALRWLLPRLPDMYGRYPEIRCRINAAYGHIDQNDRSFDVAIELSNGNIPRYESTLLMPEFIFPACSPVYLSERPFLKEAADLSRCTLLHDGDAWIGEADDAEWSYWLTEVGSKTVDSRQGLFFSLSDMCVEAALRGQGVAMARASLVGDLVRDGALVSLFDLRIKSPVSYFLVCTKEALERPAVRTTIAWLHEQAAQLAMVVDA